jgi:hypothetical protein
MNEVFEYRVFDRFHEYIETVHMTMSEFEVYFNEHFSAEFFNKLTASACWQK